MNVWVILILMLCVAGFTMVSGLLIIILERTNFIGVMKAMGADNDRIRHIFLFFAAMIIGRGLLWGNALAAALILCQEVFHPVTLDPQSYYVETVPLYVHMGYVLLIDVFTMVVSVMALVVPSYLISNIHPARSIRFE
jgi:lipoprotein-releasing system permease protein